VRSMPASARPRDTRRRYRLIGTRLMYDSWLSVMTTCSSAIEVLDLELGHVLDDGGAPGVRKLLDHLVQLLDQHLQLPRLAAQDALQLADQLLQLAQLLLQVVGLQRVSRPSRMARIARACSPTARTSCTARAPPRPGLRRCADDGDHLVDVLQRDEQALDDVRLRPRLLQVVRASAAGSPPAVVAEPLQHLLQRQLARHAVSSASMIAPNVACRYVCLYSAPGSASSSRRASAR
jgi:hypothetical protein